MGSGSSSSNRRNPNPPSQLLSSSQSYPSGPDPWSSEYPYHAHHQPPPPPPQLPPQAICTSSSTYSGAYGGVNYANPATAPSNFGSYYANHNNGWAGIQRPPVGAPPPPPPTYVEHQQAKKVRNDVNVNKDTLRLELDEENPDHHLVSFVFDAYFDGSITIFYFAKENSNCRFVPVYPDAYMPVKIPFQKGNGQKFRQPSGTGIDLGFFELDDLSKPWPGEDVFPLVICAEISLPSLPTDEHLSDPPPSTSPHMQITQAVLEKNNGNPFKVRVIKQILWIDGVRYELREIYGIGNSAKDINDDDSGIECVICMSEPKDTTVLPCRHLCMCSECAKELRIQSNKCPICREPIEELMEIKVNDVDQ